jgi:hypothetical protein
MANPITLQTSPGLSEILGAYDTGHRETVVARLKPASGVLTRGSVLSAVAADAGALTLTAGGAEATAYGILLDKSVDTAAPYSGGTVTASVARAGSFRGPALIVGAGTDEAALAKQLRLLGIFVEGAIAPVALTARESKDESTKRRAEDERPVANAESLARRQREEDEERRRRHNK